VKRGLGLGQLPEAAEGLVLDFVGRGEWFFVGQISRKWRHRYLKHFSQRRSSSNSSSNISITASKSRRSTSYKSVLASLPRLQLAISNGFDVERKIPFVYNSYVVAFAAGRYADKDVLQWLKTHHTVLWGESVCGGAVKRGRVDMLKWLHEEQQCDWNVVVRSAAAQSNNLPMLKYIYRKRDGGIPSKHDERELRCDLALSAVHSNNVTLLRWCEKHRLLVDGYARGDPNMYNQSIMSNSTAVQP
jgi:hypothetical protein